MAKTRKRSTGSKTASSVFDVSKVDFTSKEEGSVERFNPDPSKGLNGTYRAVVRFVPNIGNIEKSIIKKYVSFLTDPASGDKKAVDSYRTIGKDRECPIVQTFFKIYHSGDASLEQYKSMFVQRENYYALVQVLEDDNNKDNVGKILWWRFGVQIKQKFDAEIKPTRGPSRNPLDVFDGRPLSVEVVKRADYNNYDKCDFFDPDEDEPYNILIDGEPLTEDFDMEEAAAWIKENSPDITKYDFQEWDDETRTFVNRVIDNVLGNNSSRATAGRVEVEDVSDDEDDEIDDEIEEDIKSTKKKSAPKKAKKKAQPEPVDDEDDYDDEDDEDDVFDDDDIDLDDFDLDD